MAAALVLLGIGLVLSAAGGWVLPEVLEHLPTYSSHTCQLGVILLGIGTGLVVLALDNILAFIATVRGCWAGE